ncbi:hypothetical protein Ct9H90mP29_11050 [bacterium]|nr:MAG: hypothetical protein Ct9H90mP29_11050 [bacterium]
MGPFNLYYDYRDILRAPRLALSGKKIWILIIGNIAGFITYWVFSYLSLYLAGITIGMLYPNMVYILAYMVMKLNGIAGYFII